MSSSVKLLVLSAGRGIGLDGFHKLKLVSPSTGETIIQRYIRQFGQDVTVVVGYRAPELMADHSDLTYRYNYNWFETGSAFSAHLGLTSSPTIVVPSDLFISDDAAEQIMETVGNTVFTLDTENRSVSAVNVTQSGASITGMYSGPKRNGLDQEFCGIVRIDDTQLLEQLSETCKNNPSAAFSDCVEMHKENFQGICLNGYINEINSVGDYMEFFEKDKSVDT